MAFRRWWLVGGLTVMLLAGGCAHQPTRTQGLALPSSPDACAGSDGEENDAERAASWTYTVDNAGPSVDAWVGFSDPRSIEEVFAMTSGLRVRGLLAVFPLRGAGSGWVKGMIGLGTTTSPHTEAALASPEAATTSFQLSLARYVDDAGGATDAARADARIRLAQGEIPVGGVRFQGERAALASLLGENPCLAFSLASGESTSQPRFGPRVGG